jgi:hypothetical protein
MDVLETCQGVDSDIWNNMFVRCERKSSSMQFCIFLLHVRFQRIAPTRSEWITSFFRMSTVVWIVLRKFTDRHWTGLVMEAQLCFSAGRNRIGGVVTHRSLSDLQVT